MTVGERIRERRLELGMTQEELAERMGYSGKTSISKAETYGDNITTAKVSRFAKALNCTESYLMGWEEPEGTLEERRFQVLLKYFEKLNDSGFIEAKKRIEELTELSKYRKED